MRKPAEKKNFLYTLFCWVFAAVFAGIWLGTIVNNRTSYYQYQVVPILACGGAALLVLVGAWRLWKRWAFSLPPKKEAALVAGLLAAVGAWLKLTVAIMLIAILIDMALGTPRGARWKRAGCALAVLVTALFVCDLVITVLGIAHMNQDIGRIDDIVRAMRAGSDILAENIGDTALAVDRKVAGAKPAAAARLDLARAELMDSRRRVAMRLMKAFPHMHSTRYTEGFERIRQWIEEEKRSRTGRKNDDAQ